MVDAGNSKRSCKWLLLSEKVKVGYYPQFQAFTQDVGTCALQIKGGCYSVHLEALL